jgi:ribose-phosphate pyrophosphokinase
LSGPAIERIEESAIQEMVITDTIPLSEKAAQSRKIKVLSVAGLLAETIRRIYGNESVSSLFV